MKRGRPIIDLRGEVFGRLTVVSLARTGRRAAWFCECGCGEWYITSGSSLTAPGRKVVSCGCLRREIAGTWSITHGCSRGHKLTPEYQTWRSMWQRCTDRNCPAFDDYGGRGITVCDRWRSFEAFLADMGERPKDRSIDRIENNLGYEPSNCRWATKSEQALNRRPKRKKVA